MYPHREFNLRPLGLWDYAQPTEPHRSGPQLHFMSPVSPLVFKVCSLAYGCPFIWGWGGGSCVQVCCGQLFIYCVLSLSLCECVCFEGWAV